MNQEVLNAIKEEAERIGYGQLLIEVSVFDTKIKNVQIETKRSIKIAEGNTRASNNDVR